MVGSYSVPEWLERLKTDYHHGGSAARQLREIHDIAIKAALKDQERAGIDIVSDGELRRDNDIDYFLGRIPGVEIRERGQGRTTSTTTRRRDVRRCRTDGRGARGALGWRTTSRSPREQTDSRSSSRSPGRSRWPGAVAKEGYADRRDLVLAFAQDPQREARALAAARRELLQIDEPFLAGYPEEVELAVRGDQRRRRGRRRSNWALHICYGNRHARPPWEGHYDFLFPAVLEAHVDQLVLEFARKGYDDLALVQQVPAAATSGWA